MSNSSTADDLRIAKHLLLSSPPGQFDLILSGLSEILQHPLTSKWKEDCLIEYNQRTGYRALVGVASTDTDNDGDYSEEIKRYLRDYYTSHGVKSHYIFDTNENTKTTNILLYAERVQLQHYHAGSWSARYTIEKDADSAASPSIVISGKITLHAHTFENGNVQIRSTADLAPLTLPSASPLAVLQQIQSWEEEAVMKPLEKVYEDMSSEILKKLRRTMPITRTRFDWNESGHRGIRELGSQVQTRI